MAQVLLENITKIYEEKVTAVSDFSLEARDGEFMVIVGPSGCGKTTLLRIIAGLEKPACGNIYIGGTLVNNVPPKQRNVAMVFQNYALYPHMSVYDNMAFALRMQKLPPNQIKNSVEQVAHILGVENLMRQKPHTLSGGQQQRVAIGRAIVRSPNVFLFDEPLSNLDAALRLGMRSELKALHQRLRTTTIYVTHDQAEAMTLGERLCVMHQGKIQQVGSPLQTYEQPVNRFVAGFLGTPPMNFFTGFIKFKNGDAYFVIGRHTIAILPRLRAQLSDYCGREMVLGIRPGSFSLRPFPGYTDNTILATVNLIEQLGVRADVHLSTDTGVNFVASVEARANPAPIEPGGTVFPKILCPTNACAQLERDRVNDVVTLYIDLERIHIFEPGPSGRNVTLLRPP